MASEARRLPVGGGLVISRQRLVDVIDRMRVAVPREVYDARDVLERRDHVLRSAQEEAAQLVEQSKAEMEKQLATGGLAGIPFGGFPNGGQARVDELQVAMRRVVNQEGFTSAGRMDSKAAHIRLGELLNESENLRQIEFEWRRCIPKRRVPGRRLGRRRSELRALIEHTQAGRRIRQTR